MTAPFVSRYRVLGHLASGGMGSILLARRQGPAGFEKLVVLKRPLAERGAAVTAALLAEARLLARINHPNVCQVLDLEEGEDGLFLVLEYLEGLSLWSLLAEAERAGAPPDARAVCAMLAQACDGLEAIHALASRGGAPAGIVHRDISPGNLFLTEAGLAKVLDLGIAKHDESETRTPADTVKGKLPWLSPEQVAGRAVDRRSDLFSLGLVAYDVALGRRPQPHRVGALACGELELARLPAPLARVVQTAVALEPAARFPSAAAMGAALREAGRALGEPWGAAELARWAADHFGAALAAARAVAQGAIDDPTEVDSPTRALELRSLGAAGDDSLGDPAVAAGDAFESPPTAALPRGPELVRERTAGWVEEVRAQLDGKPAPARRSSWRGAAIAAVAVIAVAIIAVVLARDDSGSVSAGGAGSAAAALVSDTGSAGPSAPAGVDAAAPPAPAYAGSAADAAPPPAPPPAPAHAPAVRPPPPRPAARGWLAIESDPFAEIELDGRSLGPTPLWKVSVTAGRHVLRAELGDGRTQQRAVEARAGATVAVRFRW